MEAQNNREKNLIVDQKRFINVQNIPLFLLIYHREYYETFFQSLNSYPRKSHRLIFIKIQLNIEIIMMNLKQQLKCIILYKITFSGLNDNNTKLK